MKTQTHTPGMKTSYTIRKWIWGPGHAREWAIYVWDNFLESWRWENIGTFKTRHLAKSEFIKRQAFWESRRELYEEVSGTRPIDSNGQEVFSKTWMGK